MNPFTVKPKHWWSYLNPLWWRRKRVLETIIKYQWERQRLDKKFRKAINYAILLGEGKTKVDWK